MIVFDRYTYTCENILKIMGLYFKDEGRDVKTSFSNNERGEKIIKAKEKISVDGVTKIFEREMTKEEIEEIIFIAFARAGLDVVDIISYGAMGTSVKEGNFSSIVKEKEENQFVVITKKEQKINIK